MCRWEISELRCCHLHADGLRLRADWLYLHADIKNPRADFDFHRADGRYLRADKCHLRTDGGFLHKFTGNVINLCSKMPFILHVFYIFTIGIFLKSR